MASDWQGGVVATEGVPPLYASGAFSYEIEEGGGPSRSTYRWIRRVFDDDGNETVAIDELIAADLLPTLPSRVCRLAHELSVVRGIYVD